MYIDAGIQRGALFVDLYIFAGAIDRIYTLTGISAAAATWMDDKTFGTLRV